MAKEQTLIELKPYYTMTEEPNFEYKYDFVLWKSFSARLSLAILVIAASVFLVALLAYLYFSEEMVREETAQRARIELREAVISMRVLSVQEDRNHGKVTTDALVEKLRKVKPYPHSYTLMSDSLGQLIYTGDSALLGSKKELAKELLAVMRSSKGGMEQVMKATNVSLLIHEPVGVAGLHAAVVCSRADILASYKSLIIYGALAFVLGLAILFACCALAIYRMVRPLHLFAESAMSIAEGNLETPLPEIKSEDELKQLRNAFGYMQTSLGQYIEDLKTTTAAKEHMLSELTIAHDIQMGMTPKTFPQRSDLSVFANMKPAREVGGDLYDFVIEGDEMFFIVGDVAGKGVPASLYMAVTRTLFRQLAGNYQSASNIVREINRAIASENDACIFVTLFVGVLDLRTQMLTYCNAAHCAPVLIPPDGSECRLLHVMPNVPIGIVDRYDFDEQQMAFDADTALLLYTDGLTEATNDERQLFGEEQLLREVEMCRMATPREMVGFIAQRVERFAGDAEQNDDLTMLCLRYNGLTTKKHDDNRHLLLKNELAEVERLRSFILSVCRELGADEPFAMSVNLAAEEVVVNIINYAYDKGTRGHINIYANRDGNKLMLRIEDRGAPFDPTTIELADTTLSLDERPIGGLGIHLVRSIMDSLTYERSADGRNILTLYKKLDD